MEKQIEKYLSSFKKELISLRKMNEWTQKQVATQIGITMQSYQAYESGVAVPTLQNFLKLAILFEITPNELLGIE